VECLEQDEVGRCRSLGVRVVVVVVVVVVQLKVERVEGGGYPYTLHANDGDGSSLVRLQYCGLWSGQDGLLLLSALVPCLSRPLTLAHLC